MTDRRSQPPDLDELLERYVDFEQIEDEITLEELAELREIKILAGVVVDPRSAVDERVRAARALRDLLSAAS